MARRKKKSRNGQTAIMPLPEAINGDKWSVVAGLPFVELGSRVMSVPVSDDEAAASSRAHEMAHVRITPPEPLSTLARRADANPDTVNVVEDMRAQHFLQQRGVPYGRTVSDDAIIQGIMEFAKDERKLVLVMTAAEFTPNGTFAKKMFYDLVPNAREIGRRHQMVQTFYENLRQEIICRTGQDPIETVDGFESLTAPVARLFDELFPPRSSTPGEIPLEYWRYTDGYAHVGKWGEMQSPITASMSLRRKQKSVSGRTWSEEGVVPRATYRALLDGRVFSRKRRIKGGTVLIDASGSMSFSPENLEAVISAAPGAVVAAYAGRNDYGKLAIVAKNGCMSNFSEADEALSCGGRMSGNVVDGPALEWLARQPAPRIWVSDGGVTGINDNFALNLVAEANAICRRADIERIEDWRDVVEALK